MTNKSNIRTWSNARGEGRLFSVDFIDQSGEIRASAFNEQCDKFYDLLQIDNVRKRKEVYHFYFQKNLRSYLNFIRQQVYYVSRGTLKAANKQYSNLNNDYEMTFTNETVIEPCNETDNIPHINLQLLPLSELVNKNANELVGN